MTAIILGIGIPLILASVAAIVLLIMHRMGRSSKTQVTGYKTKSTLLIACSAVVFLAALLCTSFIGAGLKVVESGEIGVIKTWGEITDTMQPGTKLINPVANTLIILDAKIQQIDSEIEAYSNDSQKMNAQVGVQFHIKSEEAKNIVATYGEMGSLKGKITSVAIESMKVVLSGNTADKIIKNRQEVIDAIGLSVSNALAAYPVTVDKVTFTDITFSDAFLQAVEQKMIAEQEKLKAETEKEKAVIVAEQEKETAQIKAEADLIVAQKDAEKALVEAEGKAKAALAEAQGQANALKAQTIEVARMLGFTITETELEDGTINYEIDTTGKTAQEIKVISDYIQYIKYLETWDGTLPTVVGDGSSLSILIPSNPAAQRD
jgi:regulator of protease activity HflC (stomatin/prohibitin superfamily)